jgi:hypothetical protein
VSRFGKMAIRSYRPSDSQGSVDYSSDSDYDESPSISHSPSLEQKGLSKKKQAQQPQVIIGGRSSSQIKELLTLCTGDSNYELGSENWRSFWSSSMTALGASYYQFKDQSQVSSSDKLKSFDKQNKSFLITATTGTGHSSSSSSYQATNLLTQEKQQYVLSILNKMESQLEKTREEGRVREPVKP